MATTTIFHLPSSGAPPVSPPYSTVWDQTGEADRIFMPLVRKEEVRTALTDKTVTVPITTSQQILVRQYVSEPLPAQYWYSATSATGPIRMTENLVTANAFFFVVIKMVSPEGVTRWTGLAQQIGTEVPITTPETRILNNTNTPDSRLSYTGDRLVYEVGFDAVAPSAAGTATMRFGNPAGVADFANTNALTTDLVPWLAIAGDRLQRYAMNPNTGTRPHPFQPGLTR